MDVGHAEVEAEALVVVAHAHAVRADQPGAVRDAVVVGGDYAPLARGDVLGRVKGEAAGAPGPGAPALLLGPVGLRGVLDNEQAMPGGYLFDAGHLSRVAVQ